MIEAFTADQVRAAEAPLLAAERGFAGGLMHRAATALALAAVRELRALRPRRTLRPLRPGRPLRGGAGTGTVVGATVVGLVGPGNNGGDTLHALALLAARGVGVTAVLTSAAVHQDGLAAVRAAGGRLLTLHPEAPGDRTWAGEALAQAFAADVVLDGLLGIGGRGGLRGAAAELVAGLDELCRDVDPQGQGPGTDAGRPRVIAVDVPSGIGVEDGGVQGPVLRADRTVCFGAVKAGLLLPPATALVGRLEVVDLGLEAVLADQVSRGPVQRLEVGDVRRLWPVPRGSDHKYSRGVVGVVAGTSTYPGAAVLTVAGAQGAGCGMVRYVGPEPVASAVVAAHPEVVASTTAEVHVQAWVLGPGLSAEDEQSGRAQAALAQALERRLPVVVDAGGLTLVPERLDPLVVLTPHAGELAALLVARGVEVGREQVEAEPVRWAAEAHRRTGATVLLKGATTVVVGASGVLSQAEAPAWLATAGAGDVLAGTLGALLAGRAADLVEEPALVARCAAAAALVHGRAADRASGGGPVTAGAVARALPATVAAVLGAG